MDRYPTLGAILFDKDGTLFEFGATWQAWARGFLLRVTEGDVTRAARIGWQIGFDMRTDSFRPDSIVIAGTPAQIVAALAPHLPEITPPALLELINQEAGLAPQKPAVALGALLDGLRGRGLRLGVATNDAEAPARAHLSTAGVLEQFDFIAGFDSGHGAKPGPGQMHAFAGAIGVPSRRIAMVGDSTHDLLAGRAAGMVTVGVLTGLAQARDLKPLADAVLPDIGHLPRWLDGRIAASRG